MTEENSTNLDAGNFTLVSTQVKIVHMGPENIDYRFHSALRLSHHWARERRNILIMSFLYTGLRFSAKTTQREKMQKKGKIVFFFKYVLISM